MRRRLVGALIMVIMVFMVMPMNVFAEEIMATVDLHNGESCIFKNNSSKTEEVLMATESDSAYVSYVVYNNDGSVAKSAARHLYTNRISVPANGTVNITLAEGNSITVNGPHNVFTGEKISTPAMATVDLNNGESCILKNNSSKTEDVLMAVEGGFGSVYVSYIVYNNNGSVAKSGTRLLHTNRISVPANGTVSITLVEGTFIVVNGPYNIFETVADTPSGYLYDTLATDASIVLPIELLANVTDKDSAVSAIQNAISGLTIEQKSSAIGIDLLTLFAEEAVAQAASTMVRGGDIMINQSNVQALQASSNELKIAAEQAMTSGGITTMREMNAGVKFKTEAVSTVSITIDPSAANTTVDQVRVQTSAYEISLSKESIKANTTDSPLIITITDNSVVAATNTTTYSISFNKPIVQTVKVSLQPIAGDPTYQAITNSAENVVGGKYNPVTEMLEVKISDNDTYTVRDNKKDFLDIADKSQEMWNAIQILDPTGIIKDFSDIADKSQEMRNAIQVLASKGIISGTTSTTFSPDGMITRAEIAALIMRTLSKLDPNADGRFTDVSRSSWYFGAVGSAKRFGIINGTSIATFAPVANIQKDQIVAICARTLRAEMKYKNPSDVESLLTVYTDRGDIPAWGTVDIALATRENLVVKRTDGKFTPNTTITRGEAAIILYRMFMKIW